MMRILLADDHKLVREGMRLYLESQGIQVVGEAVNGREALELARELLPDVVIMDVNMPELSGVEATRRIRHDHDEIRVLVLTAYNEASYIHSLLDAGADGFVLKTASLSEVYQALLDVEAGRTVFTAEQRLKAEAYRQAHTELVESLTERERDVLYQAARGLTNKEIGQTLFVSDRTVQGHLQNIYDKLGVSTRTEAVTRALALQLIRLQGDAP